MHYRSTGKPAKLNGKPGWPPDWTRHSIPKAKEDPQLSPMLLQDQGHWTSNLWIWQHEAREGASQHVVDREKSRRVWHPASLNSCVVKGTYVTQRGWWQAFS